MKYINKKNSLLSVLLLLPALVNADELNGANTSWILTSTALVLFMTIPGLALFYAGLVRRKNVLSVLMQCFAITCVASVVWLVYTGLLPRGGGAAIARKKKSNSAPVVVCREGQQAALKRRNAGRF